MVLSDDNFFLIRKLIMVPITYSTRLSNHESENSFLFSFPLKSILKIKKSLFVFEESFIQFYDVGELIDIQKLSL